MKSPKPDYLPQSGKARLMLMIRGAANAASFGDRVRLPKSLARRIFKHIHGTVHIKDFDGDLVLDLRLHEEMQRRIFWMGYYNDPIVAVMTRMLKKGMTVVDVGANIGEIAMTAARRVGRDGRVIAFEPFDENANELQNNLVRNDFTQVQVVRTALADKTTESAPIYLACDTTLENQDHDGLRSLYGNPLQQKVLGHVTTTTMDAWCANVGLERIDLVKIDIEGGELPCLRGAEATLQRFRPHLIVEVQEQSAVAAGYHASDILDYLSGFSYQFQDIGERGRLTTVTARTLKEFQNVLCTPV